jgi:hypothetical protein
VKWDKTKLYEVCLDHINDKLPLLETYADSARQTLDQRKEALRDPALVERLQGELRTREAYNRTHPWLAKVCDALSHLVPWLKRYGTQDTSGLHETFSNYALTVVANRKELDAKYESGPERFIEQIRGQMGEMREAATREAKLGR